MIEIPKVYGHDRELLNEGSGSINNKEYCKCDDCFKLRRRRDSIYKLSIHDYLGKTKHRAILLFPPLISCILCLIVPFIRAIKHLSFPIPTFIFVTYLASVICMFIGMAVIFWSDYKRDKIKYGI